MQEIKYINFSDMHFGARNSLLTSINNKNEVTPLKSTEFMIEMIKILKEIIRRTNIRGQKPILILNGDILELALSDTNNAIMAFDRFIELVYPKEEESLFDKKIIFVPGNHDHHIWEIARETQYINFIKTFTPDLELEKPWHTTKIYKKDGEIPLHSYFLNQIIRRHQHLKDVEVEIAYPNLALINDEKCILLHHGHFLESIYTLMSELLTMIFPQSEKPDDIYELEAENFAWIDFFWSTLGRSGQAGQKVEVIYDSFQAQKKIKKLIQNFGQALAKKKKYLSIAPEIFIDFISVKCFDFFKSFLKNTSDDLTSLETGIKTYLETYLLDQLKNEKVFNEQINNFTFIFGHTHQPFEKEMTFKDYPGTVNVINSGGWVVDTLKANKEYGGSAIIISDTFEVSSIKVFDQESSVFNVSCIDSNSEFFTRIKGIIENLEQEGKLKYFSEIVKSALAERFNSEQQVLDTIPDTD